MKPLRIFTSTLTNPPRYYASRVYKELGEGRVVITGNKEDVTDEINAIVKSEPVGASLSAQTPPHLAQRFHETYERLAPQFGYISRVESAKPWAEVPVRNKDLMIAVCAELLGGAAQEGDCPCGATVVRKSDSTNKSKLCADCAAQEEAPREEWRAGMKEAAQIADHFANDELSVVEWPEYGLMARDRRCDFGMTGVMGERIAAAIRAKLTPGVVAEEEAGAPTDESNEKTSY